MRRLHLFALLPGLFISSGLVGHADESFTGILAYEVAYEKTTTALRYYSDGEHLRIEAGAEGNPHLIWLAEVEDVEGIVLLSPFNKSYTIEPAGPIGRPGHSLEGAAEGRKKERKEAPINIPEPLEETVMGLDGLHYSLETEGPDTDVWILKNALPFPISVLRLWTDLSEAAPAILRICNEHQAIPIRVERVNWRGKSIFSMNLVRVETGVPPAELFTIPEEYSRTQMSGQRGGNQRGGKPGGGSDRRGPPPGSGGGRPR